MSQNDKNFDSRVVTFKKNIYGTGKGKIREAVLMRDLTELLANKDTLSILDIGGGQGQIALQLAQLGHKVTITDISSEMLSIAKEQVERVNIEGVRLIHCPLQQLDEHLDEKFDLVLCHAVFEWLDDPKSALETLKYFCKKDGTISLMFYNHVGQTLSNLIYGNFDYIKAGMKAKKVVKLNPQSSINPDALFAWCNSLNLKVFSKTGVRCFHDYIRDISKWESDFEQILEMELEYSKLEPYANIARYMHLLIKHGT